nr:Gfo/Idh/MocA family oxidoreductase [Candidatus Omnitrophota bacterium]
YAYSLVDGVELVAVCDSDKKLVDKCIAKWKTPRGYYDISSMLKSENVDILSVCTPPDTHLAVLEEAVKHNSIRGIFCEKPLASTLKDAEKMREICDKNGIILQVGHQRRFDPLHLEIKKAIDDGIMGELQQANFYYTAGISNTGSHMFDILRFFFGDVEWIEAFPSVNMSGKDNDPNLDGILRFKSGRFVTFQACDVAKYLVFELNAFFERARIELKNSGFKVDFFEVRESEYYSGYKELFSRKSPFTEDYQRNFMINAVKHLMRCLDAREQPVSSVIDGFKAVELIENAIISARNDGKRIHLQ